MSYQTAREVTEFLHIWLREDAHNCYGFIPKRMERGCDIVKIRLINGTIVIEI